MKAKHFKKLRAKSQYYYYEVHSNEFGNFLDEWDGQILARTDREAAKKVVRRVYGLYLPKNMLETQRAEAKIKICPVLTPSEEFVRYY